jgi:hypothetical protein
MMLVLFHSPMRFLVESTIKSHHPNSSSSRSNNNNTLNIIGMMIIQEIKLITKRKNWGVHIP